MRCPPPLCASMSMKQHTNHIWFRISEIVQNLKPKIQPATAMFPIIQKEAKMLSIRPRTDFG